MRVIKLFCMSAIVSLSTLHSAADEDTITLMSVDGACVTIAKSAAQCSPVLHDALARHWANRKIKCDSCANEQELGLLKMVLETTDETLRNLAEAQERLGDSMLPEVRKMYEKNARATVRCYIESDAHFISLATIARTHGVPWLDGALLKEFATVLAYTENAAQNKELLDNTLQQIAHLCECSEQLTPLQKEGMDYIGMLVRRAITEDKKKVLEIISADNQISKKEMPIFFTGLSMGELSDALGVPEYLKHNAHEVNFVFEWGDLTSLEGLRCNCDDDFLQQKKRLRITDTSIDYLPAHGFLHVHNPEIVELHDNKIREMHVGAFAGLSALTKLDLSDNKLKQIPAGAFDCLIALKKLLLADNELVSFNAAELLRNNRSITKLDLEGNQLEEIPTDWPPSCANMEELDFSHNRIKAIPANLFKQLKELKYLFLESNKIESVQLEMFDECENLETLRIHDNQIPDEQAEKLCKKLPKVHILH